MPNRKPKKPASRAQARLLGAVAGGQLKIAGLTPEDARAKLRGVKYKKLPRRK